MTFYIHTYGCQMNVRDSEAAAALLVAAGLEQAASEDEAQLVIVNSCSVREKAEDKAVGKLGLLCASKRERPDRLVGLMGCMAQRMKEQIFKRVPGLDFAAGTRLAGAIPRLVERVRAGEHGIGEFADFSESPEVAAEHEGCGGSSAFVTILLGCNRRCAYCIVPDVRGPEYSRPAREVLAEIRALAARGVCEVTLLGQSIMNYGLCNPVWFEGDAPSPLGCKKAFPRLLEAVALIPGIQRIRFTSGHPSGVNEELVRVISAYPAICRHLHLPVQSGSDTVLKRMRRGYTREQYLESLAQIRQMLPEFSFTTDVIVGFPGESDEDFEATRSLMEAADFDNAFIFKYSPRPGTPSAAWQDDVSDEEKMRRNQVLLSDQDCRSTRRNAQRLDSIQSVLVEGPSLRNPSRWCGRNDGNLLVIFDPRPDVRAGTLAKVRITRVTPQTLYGDLL